MEKMVVLFESVRRFRRVIESALRNFFSFSVENYGSSIVLLACKHRGVMEIQKHAAIYGVEVNTQIKISE
jgi:hypothetical protein